MAWFGIAAQHADDVYSREVEILAVQLFTVYFECIHQMAPRYTVQEVGSSSQFDFTKFNWLEFLVSHSTFEDTRVPPCGVLV